MTVHHRDAFGREMLDMAEACEALSDFDTQEAVDLNNALHALLPEPKCVQPPNYLRSIDAALTLVPEINGSIPYPQISRVSPESWSVHIGYCNRAPGVTAKAASPALALCAAALRARSSS